MNTLPACCAPLQHHWPLPRPLPGAVLVSCTFDPTRLAPDDFQRAGIVPSASLQRSVAKRQAEYLAGRVCARAALQRLDGRDYVPATHEDRSPIWPAGIHGSITHGQGWAAAVVAAEGSCQGLGLDQEALLDDERAERLMGEILTAAELERLDSHQLGLTVTLTFVEGKPVQDPLPADPPALLLRARRSTRLVRRRPGAPAPAHRPVAAMAARR